MLRLEYSCFLKGKHQKKKWCVCGCLQNTHYGIGCNLPFFHWKHLSQELSGPQWSDDHWNNLIELEDQK